jgi:hypothetical protein
MCPIPTITFPLTFSPIGPIFHMDITGDMLGYCCSNFPNITKVILDYPNMYILGDRLLGDWWRHSSSFGTTKSVLTFTTISV